MRRRRVRDEARGNHEGRCDLIAKVGVGFGPNGVDAVLAFAGGTSLRELDRLRRAILAAKLQVPIAASYPLARAAQAHRRIATGHVLGKIVLRVMR